MLLGLFLLIGLLLLLLLKFSVDFELNTSDLSMKPTISMGVGPLRAAVPASLLAKIGTLLRGRPLRDVRDAVGRANTAIRIVDNLLQEVDLLHLEIWFGLYDPYWTALGCGGFWAVLGSLLSALGSKPRFKVEPRIAVHPDFSQAALRISLRCIFRFRVGQIIFSEMKRLGGRVGINF
ncbi:MAG TPA: DUF2953 domain-containing protein [Firmicutes bacterium]|nr:DUF2953 domain-containing protein [Bacillota bacterium]